MADVFRIGQLVDMEWRLGVAVKSSNCKALSAPFVSVLLRVQDSDKKIQTHTLELTLAEFQVCII
jgi:hypothetical protein